jgi:hypothetical protein
MLRLYRPGYTCAQTTSVLLYRYTLLTEEDNRLFLISYTIVMSPLSIGYRPLIVTSWHGCYA